MSISKRTKDGRIQYRARVGYTDVYGNYKRYQSKWYDLKKEAIKDETEFRNNISFNTSCAITFKEAFDLWIKESTKTNKPKTIVDKKRLIEIYCPDQMMDKRLSSLTPAYIQKYVLETEEVIKLSYSRKNKLYDCLNGTFKHAMIYNGLASNPMDQIARFQKTDKEKIKEVSIYTPYQFERLYNAFEPRYKKYADFFYMLYWTGMRLNECRSLTFSDFDGKSLNLRKQLDEFNGNEWTSLKWNSKRKVTLTSDCIQIIEKNRESFKDLPGFNDEWFIFGGYKPFSSRTLERVKNDTIQKNNLPNIRIHDFRHSHASYLIDKGVNIYKISKRLGHSSIKITLDTYGHLLDTEGDEILNALENK